MLKGTEKKAQHEDKPKPSPYTALPALPRMAGAYQSQENVANKKMEESFLDSELNIPSIPKAQQVVKRSANNTTEKNESQLNLPD